MMPRRALSLCLGLAACPNPSPEVSGPRPAPPLVAETKADPAPAITPPEKNAARDIVSTRLSVDLAHHRATARIELAEGSAPGASFEAAGLTVDAVRDGERQVPFEIAEGWLHVAAPATAVAFDVDYRFRARDSFDGAKDGITLTWPYHCGNLFPCDSNPEDGVRFELSLEVPEGKVAVYPRSLAAEAPSYMLAWAVGDFEHADLGRTSAGTRVSLWTPPASTRAVETATRRLPELFDWLERTYGDYPFGDHVGSVIVEWGPSAYGGMEHHPYWHVSVGDASDLSVHVHEAAHGWFGNSVRIACWEDFVLSEGTVTYMATRAIEEVLGAAAGRERWRAHQARLDALQAGQASKIAWPEGCNELDILEDGLFGPAPYVKGALFFRAVAQRVGVGKLDAILREFHAEYGGRAAGFEDLLALIRARTGYDPRACARAWLRENAVPGPRAC